MCIKHKQQEKQTAAHENTKSTIMSACQKLQELRRPNKRKEIAEENKSVCAGCQRCRKEGILQYNL